MAEVTYAEIADAVVTRIKDQVTALDQVTYPAPEKPLASLSAWVEIGPTTYELGNLEIAMHQIKITVAVPAGAGGYSGQVRTIHAAAFECLKAFRGDTLVADEAAVSTQEAVVSAPFTGMIGGQGGQEVVGVTATFFVETLDDVTDEIEE